MNLMFISSILLLSTLNSVICDSECNTLKTCGDCIGYPAVKCVWCAKDGMDAHRCESEEILTRKGKVWCSSEFLYNPNSTINILLNKDFKSVKDGDEVIQFMPQMIDIKVRPAIPVEFEMSYKPAKDFPLDVYLLMDVSYSMQSVNAELRRQAFDIYNRLTYLSNNVHLGIGSFVEKQAFPYYDKNQRPKKTSYSFKNNLPLTDDKQKFKDLINDSPSGANFDDLEAGFDALMQVMTCVDEIKWRNNSRRIIVYVTESPYHSVGDGKMIGIIKPNDMQCHYKDGLHETELALDYPSVSQINAIALKKKIKIIYVAKPVVRDVYVALENYILDSKYEELKTGSKTVEVIERAYKELTANVALDRRDWPSFIDLILDQDCKSSSQLNCKITPAQPIVTIPAKLKVNICPEKKIYKLEIGPRSASDILTINLEIDCECKCEKNNAVLSSKCNNAGFYQCGVCKCSEGSYGDDCGCSGTYTTTTHLDKCRANQNDTNLCSGRGICRCGKCESCPGFSGEFCQYDNTACPQYDDKLCSGNGKCFLGKCQCDEFWRKDDCSCSLSNEACIAPYSHEVCSGHGSCVCGECVCDQIKDKDERYTGNFCDSCDDCAEKRCRELEDYVFCFYMNNTCDEFQNQTSKTVISMMNMTEFQSPPPEWRGAKRCEKRLDSKESIVFMYRTDESTRKLHIVVQNELKPPNKANIMIAVGSAIAAVILIGLLTVIIWKILIDIHDAREYKKFEEQAREEGYDVSVLNPAYVEPAVNFRNPMYDGDQQTI